MENVYVKILDRSIFRTEPLKDILGNDEGINIDYDKNGNIVGVEILNAKEVKVSR